MIMGERVCVWLVHGHMISYSSSGKGSTLNMTHRWVNDITCCEYVNMGNVQIPNRIKDCELRFKNMHCTHVLPQPVAS